jgi:hypothetical protein
MTAILRIVGIEIGAIRRDYFLLKVLLENIGSEKIGPGTVLARQISSDGSSHPVELFNTVSLAPGEKTKISQLLSGGLKEVAFRAYSLPDGENIPLEGLVKRNGFTSSLAEAAEGFINDVVAPIFRSVTATRGEREAHKTWMGIGSGRLKGPVELIERNRWSGDGKR